MEENRRMRNPLIRKFDQKIRKTGFDQNFVKAAHLHLGTLSRYDDGDIQDRDDLCNMLIAKLFLDKVDMYPEKRFSCKVDENSDWPVPLLPIEAFELLSVEFRKDCFHEFLEVGDILDCRVSSVLPSEYVLRVIHKYGCTKLLDDLYVMVKLPKKKSDLQLLEKEMFNYELIRVVVSEISKNNGEFNITVSLDKSGTEVKLGRITGESFPSYVLDPPEMGKYPSYANYLIGMPQFRKNPTLLKDFYANFGFESWKIYSFHPTFDRFVCSKESTGQALLKKSKVKDAKNYAQFALEAIKEKQESRALSFINMALELCPREEPLKATLYGIKGDIYKGNIKPAVINYTIALYLDTLNEKAKQNLSEYFFKTANGFYRTKRYRKAAIYSEFSYRVNPKNSEANSLFEYLKKKHLEDVDDSLEQESLLELHKKKKKLVSKLKKFKEEVDP